MLSRSARLPLSTLLLVFTAFVVIILGIAQFYWSRQVSTATSMRLADSLQMSLTNWHVDLRRELLEVSASLRVPPRADVHADLYEYAKRLAEWRTSAPHPNLLSSVTLLKHGDVAHAFDINVSTGDVRARKWPAFFVPLAAELDAAHEKAGWYFAPALPGLLRRLDDGWLVLAFDEEILRGTVLADLAKRYFSGIHGLDYQVAVLAGPPPGLVLYSSDPGFGNEPIRDADGIVQVFGPPPAAGGPVQLFEASTNRYLATSSAGLTWLPIFPEADRNQSWQLVVRHRRGGALGAFVGEIRRRDLSVGISVLALLVVSVAMLIILNNRAQRLARLQMDFVTTVSHELRTPLTIIRSAADNLADGTVREPEKLTRYGSVISSQARNLSGLVEELLQFAALKERRHRPPLHAEQPIDVAELIDRTLAGTHELIEAASFVVERDIEPDLPPVMGDPTALSQCLQNLIANALKYGRDGRWLGLAARAAGANGTRELQISVSDRGIGIGSADLRRIFEPFYRSPSVAGRVHGTGLGLALARGIAEAMKGRITVASAPGKGSTFTLHLPIPDDSPSEPASA
jgi:signal transduction histidine kinase